MIKILTFPCGPFETNTYLIACSQTRQAAVVDPSPGSGPLVLEALQTLNWTLQSYLLTHSHWDHIADLALLRQSHPAPVYVHSQDAPNLQSPGADGLPMWVEIQPVTPDFELIEGQKLTVGELEIQVIHTPGHSPGGVCFYLPKESILFSGDTLFKGSIGNLSFPTSDSKAMILSLEKLQKLPLQTKVYPGHGPATTLKDESWLAKAKEMFNL